MLKLDTIQTDIAALPADAQQIVFDLVDVLKKRYLQGNISKSGGKDRKGYCQNEQNLY